MGVMAIKRKRDDGLRKLCECALRSWVRCDHPWYFSYNPKGKPRVRVSLDRHAGRHVDKLEEAKGLAATLRAAVDAGTYPPTVIAQESVEVATFAVAANRFLASVPILRGKNQGKARGENDLIMVERLCAWTPPGASKPLGEHAACSVTADVYEAFIGFLRGQGRAASTLSRLHPACEGA